MQFIKRQASRNLSLANWQGRMFRLVLVCLGFWVALPDIDSTTGWAVFAEVAARPYQVFGLLIAVGGALYTRRDKADP